MAGPPPGVSWAGSTFDITAHRTGESALPFPGAQQFAGGAGTIVTSDAWIAITKNTFFVHPSGSGIPTDYALYDVAPYSGPTLRIGYIVVTFPLSADDFYFRVVQLGVPIFSLIPGFYEALPNSITMPASGGPCDPTVNQDLTQTSNYPNSSLSEADGWTATCPDSWVTLGMPIGRPAEGVTVYRVNFPNYPRSLGVGVAAQAAMAPPRTSTITFTPNATLPYVNSGTIANDYTWSGSNLFVINQLAGAGYVPPGGGGGPTAPPGLFLYGISWDVSVAGRHVMAGGLDDTNLWLGFAANKLPPLFHYRSSGIVGKYPCVRFDRLFDNARIFMAYETTAGGLYIVESIDEGRSWSAPVQINPTGSKVAFVATRHGTKHFFWFLAGVGSAPNLIQGVVWDSANNVIVPVFTAVTGVDNDEITATEFLGAQGEHRIGVGFTVSGIPHYVSAKDAQTFA